MLLLLLLPLAFAAPRCAWQCDDPTCPAYCVPKCAAPACESRSTNLVCPPPRCRIECAASPGDPSETCPSCETVCEPLPAGCSPLCEAPRCGWECFKPASCPAPRCELQCERPACAAPSRGMALGANWVLVVIVCFLGRNVF